MPNTHYVFTVGKDKLLKYWDADRFEQLLSLDGHHGEVTSRLWGSGCQNRNCIHSAAPKAVFPPTDGGPPMMMYNAPHAAGQLEHVLIELSARLCE